MVGYIGIKARKRGRRRLFIISTIVIISVLTYFYNKIDFLELTPDDDFFPTTNEIKKPLTIIDEDELKLKIFQKEQKIIFRDKQISILKEDFVNLKSINQNLVNEIESLKNEIDKINMLDEDNNSKLEYQSTINEN